MNHLPSEYAQQLCDRLQWLYLCSDDLVESATVLQRHLDRMHWYEPYNLSIIQGCYLTILDSSIEEPTRTFAIEFFKCAYDTVKSQQTSEINDPEYVCPSDEIEMY